MNRSILTGIVWVVLMTAAPHPQNAPAGQLRAGAHKVDFTPKESELQLSTDSIRDHLFARAIVVDDRSTCAVPVGIDWEPPRIRSSTMQLQGHRNPPGVPVRTSSSRRRIRIVPIPRG